jgi:hypothetical protein
MSTIAYADGTWLEYSPFGGFTLYGMTTSGYLVNRRYLDYSRSEARADFRAFLRNEN